MRTALIARKTGETDISLNLNLDGTGASAIDTGCGFLDHMLTLFANAIALLMESLLAPGTTLRCI